MIGPQLTPLEEVCTTINSGGTPSRREMAYWNDGTIPWIKTGELNDWKVQVIGEQITEAGLKNSAAKIYAPGTVLIAMYGDGKTITTMGIVDRPSATNQACCALVADPLICDPLYLFYALKHSRSALLNLVVAGAQRNLSVGTIKKFSILMVSIDAQRRIVEILRAYDELIEVNLRRIAVLEEMARGLFNEWFIRLRFPGHENVAIEHTPDGPLPEGWSWGVLGDLLTLQRGFDLPSSQRVDGDFPVVSASGVSGTHDERRVAGPGVATGRSGTIGQVHLMMGDFWPLNTALYVKDFKKAGPAYSTILLRHLNLSSHSAGAAVPTLNRNHVHGIKLGIPPSTLLNRFEKIAMDNFKAIDVIRRQSKTLSDARDFLLPRLISGQLSVAKSELELESA